MYDITDEHLDEATLPAKFDQHRPRNILDLCQLLNDISYEIGDDDE